MATTVRTLRNFIGGDWAEATGEHAREIVSPVTGEVVAEAPDASAEDVDRATKAAREAQPRWAALSAWERAKVCHAIADLIDERREEFARELSLEQGKPYVAEALPDIDETAENFRIAAEDVKRMETAIIPSQDVNKRILTFRKPNGVYAAHHAVELPHADPRRADRAGHRGGQHDRHQAVRVDARGDGELHADHGRRGPARRRRQRRLRRRRGRRVARDEPERRLHRIRRLARDGGEDRPRRRAQAQPDRGVGNGPVVVCEDADLGRAAKGAVFGGFFCAGQVCCATERVLVHRAVHDEFLDAVVKEAEGWRLGDPFDEDTLVGPMNNEPTAEKMDRHLEDAVAKGADVVLGGSRDDGRPTGLYYQPTVVDGVGLDTLVNREETFGPIVPLITVDSDDAALAAANDSHLGLQAAVYTRSLPRAFKYIEELRVGNVVVNDSTDYWEAHEPFGGASGTQTGWGRIGGRYTMLDMTDLKTVVLDFGHLD